MLLQGEMHYERVFHMEDFDDIMHVTLNLVMWCAAITLFVLILRYTSVLQNLGVKDMRDKITISETGDINQDARAGDNILEIASGDHVQLGVAVSGSEVFTSILASDRSYKIVLDGSLLSNDSIHEAQLGNKAQIIALRDKVTGNKYFRYYEYSYTYGYGAMSQITYQTVVPK